MVGMGASCLRRLVEREWALESGQVAGYLPHVAIWVMEGVSGLVTFSLRRLFPPHGLRIVWPSPYLRQLPPIASQLYPLYHLLLQDVRQCDASHCGRH